MGVMEKINQYAEVEKLSDKKQPAPSPETESVQQATDSGPAHADAPEPAAPETESETESESDLEQRCQTAESEVKAAEERLLRMAAEFENYKKRMVRDKEDLRKYAAETLIKSLLPVIDNLERALGVAGDKGDAKGLVEGVRLTHTDILKVLEQSQVKPVAALHQPFDPTFHQAIAQNESDEHPDNTVIEEYQKGYTIHGRLLRPAMVVVSKSRPAAETGTDTPE